MLNIFKKLLGKSEAPAVRPKVAVAPKAAPESLPPMPQVEVAHLSLAAIMEKLPEDLKKTIAHIPDDSVTVALPLATIQKQLPTGSVKMSLASLYRQAPSGTFKQARTEDRRMVEVPLSEVFRHVSPQLLPKREQRKVDLPNDAVALFGNSSNPYAISPAVPEESQPASIPEPAPTPVAVPQPQRVIQPPLEMRSPVAPPTGGASGVVPSPAVRAQPSVPKATPRSVSPPAGFSAPAQATPIASPANEQPLVIPLATLAAGWPEPIRSEAFSLIEAKVALPAGAVTAGLARGKVCFTWGQLRSWLTPPPPSPSQAQESTELILPLKVVAPAFLAHSKPKAPKKSVEIDETIPALFSGATPVEPPAPAPVPVPVPEPEPEPEPAQVAEEQPPAAAEIEVAPPAPTVLAPPAELQLETPSVPVPDSPQESVESVPAPAIAISEPVESATKPKLKLGEILGNPEKAHWSPPELVKATVTLPGVAGAVVALQEGLLVAADLPEPVKGDTVAAFLPQIFARLTNYAGEMKLGAVEDILFTTNGAHFQIFRLGEVYFAVLGKPGETLPWENLRLITEELAHHHQK